MKDLKQCRIEIDAIDQQLMELFEKRMALSKSVVEYKIDGLCFYHYWFSGRKILEKPAEQLLKNPEIHIPFFFSWANEPWARTWDGKNNHILMPQSYGDEADWLKHFEYLLPFFLVIITYSLEQYST